ncbi:MAG: MoaD/ThiS family protein [Dehalococcoidia bacterium]
MVTVLLTAALRPFAGGAAQVEASGATLREVITDLEQRYPALAGHLVDDAGVRSEIFLAINSEEAFGLDQAVPEGAEVHILAAMAGG